MTKAEMIEAARQVCRVRRLSRHTEQAYCHWLGRFAEHSRTRAEMGREERVRVFLEQLAPRTSASTQNQALNAVVFLYRDVLRQPLGDLGKWARAKRAKRLPSWLTRSEMERVLDQMSGVPKLMAEMAFGSGLRLAELLALRIKDIDMERCTITVRGGKSDKDRVTCLPRSISPRLTAHLERCRATWESDRAAARPPIFMPDGLERKFPRGGCEWAWFWLWPATNESRDPRSGIVRRHHLHEDTIGKALKTAARRIGMNKRVTAHVLRHSFATAFLEAGGSIHQLQELLGHSSLETTQIYLHCLPVTAGRITSPLDYPGTASTIIEGPWPGAEAVSPPRARHHA